MQLKSIEHLKFCDFQQPRGTLFPFHHRALQRPP